MSARSKADRVCHCGHNKRQHRVVAVSRGPCRECACEQYRPRQKRAPGRRTPSRDRNGRRLGRRS
ncbi:MAG TPA: hypothetical protein VLA99_00500 [Nitrospiraceae bacterium]|nr:hypothetical protein [Nitrospiraceae bacterium]